MTYAKCNAGIQLLYAVKPGKVKNMNRVETGGEYVVFIEPPKKNKSILYELVASCPDSSFYNVRSHFHSLLNVELTIL